MLLQTVDISEQLFRSVKKRYYVNDVVFADAFHPRYIEVENSYEDVSTDRSYDRPEERCVSALQEKLRKDPAIVRVQAEVCYKNDIELIPEPDFDRPNPYHVGIRFNSYEEEYIAYISRILQKNINKIYDRKRYAYSFS